MTTHLKATHKIEKSLNEAAYNSYINDSEVVPKCFLKKVNGRMVHLEGDELEAAKERKGDMVAEQLATVESLKVLRAKREEAFIRKNNARNDAERETFDQQWRAADVNYKKCVIKTADPILKKCYLGRTPS